jgi:hypothetical protein
VRWMTGPGGYTRHIMRCCATQATRIICALDDVASDIRQALPRPSVMVCHLRQATRVRSALDDLASNIRQTLEDGAADLAGG